MLSESQTRRAIAFDVDWVLRSIRVIAKSRDRQTCRDGQIRTNVSCAVIMRGWENPAAWVILSGNML